MRQQSFLHVVNKCFFTPLVKSSGMPLLTSGRSVSRGLEYYLSNSVSANVWALVFGVYMIGNWTCKRVLKVISECQFAYAIRA